jgi:hypothetical protein
MDQIRTDFNPRPFNLAMRQGNTVGPNPDLFFAPQSKIGGIIDLIPGIGGIKRGLNIIGDMLPINQRAILENEARGQGIFTDDIGRIVGDPNTVGGVMAGYNLDKMTKGTFDKRLGTIEDTLKDKYGIDVTAEGFDISDIDEDDPAFGLVGKYGRIGKAKLGFLDSKRRAKIIEDQRIAEEKARKEAKLKEEIRLANIRAAQKAAQAQADAFRKKQNAKIKFDQERARKNVLADRAAGAFSSKVQLDKDGSGNFKEQTAAKERQGVGVAGPGFGRGAYFMDGGLVDLVDIYD